MCSWVYSEVCLSFFETTRPGNETISKKNRVRNAPSIELIYARSCLVRGRCLAQFAYPFQLAAGLLLLFQPPLRFLRIPSLCPRSSHEGSQEIPQQQGYKPTAHLDSLTPSLKTLVGHRPSSASHPRHQRLSLPCSPATLFPTRRLLLCHSRGF